MTVLTLNAGSSTLKFALFDEGAPPARITGGTIEAAGAGALDEALARIGPHGGVAGLAAVGHRVVVGGPTFDRSTRLDADVMRALDALRPLDPDHLPVELAIVEAMRRAAPDTPQVACFDTAFHATLPRVARLLPLPRRYEASGLRRYGFHGLSYQYLVEELRRTAGDAAARGRVVLAHLGSGSSLAAVRDGRSVDTTMSFTPNSGVPMSTRSGDLDPGVLVHLARAEKLGVDALDEMLSRRSGLAGVSGGTGDMRELLAREATDPAAADAVLLFCHSVRKAVGALATTLDGLDTLVFSAGIGERAPRVRRLVAEGLGHLGVAIDDARNDANLPVISTPGSPCTVRVIRTDEESIIARETLELTRGGTP